MPGILKTFELDPVGDAGFLIGGFDNNRAAIQTNVAAKATAWKAGTVLGKITSSGLFTPLNPAASDGSQNAAGLLLNGLPISATDPQRATVIVREATFNANLVTFEIAVNDTQKNAALAALAANGVIGGY